MMKMKKPTTKPIQTNKKYSLYSNGELWRNGRNGYYVGYVYGKCIGSFENAIFFHQEEMQIEFESIKREFGI